MTAQGRATVTVTPAGDAVNLDRDPTVKVDPGQTSTVTGQGQGSNHGQGQGHVQRHRDPDRRILDPRRWVTRHPTGHGHGQTSTVTLTGPEDDQAGTCTSAREPWSVRWGINLAAWADTAVVLAVACVGQKMFGAANGAAGVIKVDGYDLTPWGTPFVFELTVVVLLLLGVRSVYRQASPYLYWILAAAVGAMGIAANASHAGGVIFGGASAVNLVLWFLKLHGDYIAVARAQGQRAARRPRLLFTKMMLVDRRTTFRAFIIATMRPSVTTVAEAVRLANTWCWIYDDTKKTKGKTTAKRTAWRHVDIEVGWPVIDLHGIEVAEVTFAAPPPQPAPVRPTPRPPVISRPEPPEPPVEQWQRETTAKPSNVPTSPAPAGADSRKQDPRQTYPAIFAALDAMSTGPGWVPTDGNIIEAALKAGVACPSKGTRQQRIRAAYKDAAA